MYFHWLGFEGLSGDEFLTYELAARLAESGVIETPKGKAKDKTLLKGNRKGKNSDSGEDNDWVIHSRSFVFQFMPVYF